MKKYIVILLIIPYISSCSKKETTLEINPLVIESSESLYATSIDIEENVFWGSAFSMFLIDSTLYIQDCLNREAAIWGMDTTTWKLKKKLFFTGNGRGEIHTPSFNCRYDSCSSKSISLYDENLRKHTELNIYTMDVNENRGFDKDPIFEGADIKNIIDIDSFYIATGTGGIFNEKRFIIFDSNLKVINHLPGYPAYSEIENNDLVKALNYLSEIRIKPDNSKMVIGSYIGGIFEIFDLDKIPDTISLIKRSTFHLPQFEIAKDIHKNLYCTENTIYGFENIFVTDNFIYALYFDQNKESNFPNRILVFDWDGEVVKQYIIDKALHGLCVDEVNFKIYGMAYSDEKGFYLVEIKIPNNN